MGNRETITVTKSPEAAQKLPDYLLDADAVLKDEIASWRYGRAPDYTKTRQVYAQTKTQNHEPGSLTAMVENLVKNWEVEASFKMDIHDWRTIDKENYTFSANGGPAQSADYMLKVGTYNALITPNEYYDPENSDFNSSHKTFKRMMPAFAWEVIEVYSSLPVVSFKWRHWGVMKNKYIGFNEHGEKVTVEAHGGPIDFEGHTVATLNEKYQIRSLETFFDPMKMFQQIAGSGSGRVQKVKVGRLGKYAPIQGEDPMSHLGSVDEIPEHLEENYVSPPYEEKIEIEIQAPPRPVSRLTNHDEITPEEMAKMTPADCPFLMKWKAMSLSATPSVVGYDERVERVNLWDGATIVETTTTVETIEG